MRIVQPIALTWLTAGVVVVLVVVATFLSLAQYTRKATLAGVLVPDLGLIRLLPSQAGVVTERRVREAQNVAAGEVLFVLAVERPALAAASQAQVERSLDERRRSLQDAARLQQALADTRLAALERRLHTLGVEQSQLESELATQRQRLALARESLARFESLQKENFVSPAQVQARSEEALGLQVQLRSLERQAAALARERAEIDGERRALPLQSSQTQGELRRDLAELSRESAEFEPSREVVVRAPQAGSVTAVLAEAGQHITATTALASLLPQGARLQAHLFAPSGAVGFLRPGLPVRLRYEAFPYQKYGQHSGRIEHVSRVPLAAGEIAAQALAAADRPDEPMFRVTVVLDDDPGARMPQPLMAGMRLQADVLLERRRLIEWLFEPLLGLSERL